MFGALNFYDKSINGIKTISDGISTIQNGEATFNLLTCENSNLNNATINNLISQEIDTSEINTSNINTDDLNVSNLLTSENSNLHDANITTGNITYANIITGNITTGNITTGIITTGNITTGNITNANLANVNITTSLNVSASTSTLKNISQNETSIITQTGTGTNQLKNTTVSELTTGNLTQTSGSTSLKDLTTDNITMRTNKSINQSGTTDNNLGQTTISDLTVLSSMTFPSTVTVPEATQTGDLTFTGDAKIIQDLTSGTENSFKASKFKSIQVNGNIEQTLGTTELQDTNIVGNINIEGDLNMTTANSEAIFENVNINKDINVDGTTQLKSLTLNDGTTTISNSEFQQLDGVTSNIQNQLNSISSTANTNSTNIIALYNNSVFTSGDQTVGGIKTFTSKINFSNNIVQTSGNTTLKAVSCDSLTVGSVSNTEISYLDGVTSSIQNQINNLSTGQSSLNSSVVYLSTPQTITGQKTFTNGIITNSLSVGDVSNTEISYLDGVTSSIQTQINNNSAITTNNSTAITAIQNDYVSKTIDQTIRGIKTFTSALNATAQFYGNLLYCNSITIANSLTSATATISGTTSTDILNANNIYNGVLSNNNIFTNGITVNGDASTKSISSPTDAFTMDVSGNLLCNTIETTNSTSADHEVTNNLLVGGTIETDNLIVNNSSTLNSVSCASLSATADITSNSISTIDINATDTITDSLTVNGSSTLNTLNTNTITTNKITFDEIVNNQSIYVSDNSSTLSYNTKTNIYPPSTGYSYYKFYGISIGKHYMKQITVVSPLSIYGEGQAIVGGTTQNIYFTVDSVEIQLYKNGSFLRNLSSISTNNSLGAQKHFQNTVTTPYSFEQFYTNVSITFDVDNSDTVDTYELYARIFITTNFSNSTVISRGCYLNTGVSSSSLSNCITVTSPGTNYSSSYYSVKNNIPVDKTGTLYGNEIVSNNVETQNINSTDIITTNTFTTNLVCDNINSNVKMPFGNNLMFRSLVLAYLVDGLSTTPRFYPILCSTAQLVDGDRADAIVVAPGVRVLGYDTNGYGTLLQDVNNTGFTPIYVTLSNINAWASCRVYYDGVEIKYTNIS
jgi:hypothetical protein